jgi:hypothetical protein
LPDVGVKGHLAIQPGVTTTMTRCRFISLLRPIVFLGLLGGCTMETRGLVLGSEVFAPDPSPEPAGGDEAGAPPIIATAPLPSAGEAAARQGDAGLSPAALDAGGEGGAPVAEQTDAAAIATRLAAGLVLYLRFDDGPGSSKARDDSGLDQVTTLQNLDGGSAWVGGHIQGALRFSGGGKGNWLSVTGSPALGAAGDALSIAVWLYPDGGQSSPGTLVSRAATTAGLVYLLELTREGRPHLSIKWPGATPVELTGPLALPPRAWAHLAVSSGAGKVRLYVDGQVVAAQEASCILPSDRSPLVVGAAAPAGKNNHLSGRLDELLIYGRALDDEETAALAVGARPAPRR